MAKRKSKAAAPAKSKRSPRKTLSAASPAPPSISLPATPFDTNLFESVHQVGGIQIADIQSPLGSGQSTRVAMFNTGSGLRFNVAIDRGGDLLEAFFNQHSLAYLTPNGYRSPSPAYSTGAEWLRGWGGGLLTSCGPVYFGPPREEDGNEVTLHGRHHNQPAAVEMVINPDPHRGRNEMLLSMVIRDTRMFGPNIEVRRQIQCVLGQSQIVLHDRVTNRGNQRSAHNWLYHVNLGYPLLDKGSRFVYRGKATLLGADKQSDAMLNRLKRATAPIEAHRGGGERVLMIDPRPGRDGVCHVGLINRKKKLAVQLSYDHETLPRLANWQHFGPGGSYVTGIEPFSGSLLGKDADDHPRAAQWLEPGESKSYRTTITVHHDTAAIADFAKHDGDLTVA